MKLQAIAICLIFNGVAHEQSKSPVTETGVVCVSAVPKPNSDPISLGNPDGGDRSFNYTIQIGSRKVAASTERAVDQTSNSLLQCGHVTRSRRPVIGIRSLPSQYSQTTTIFPALGADPRSAATAA